MQEPEIISIDRHFGRFVAGLATGGKTDIFLAAALVSMANRAGHACLDLSSWANRELLSVDGTRYHCPDFAPWREVIAGSTVAGSGSEVTPLVLEEERLYLRRYWEYENDVAGFLLARESAPDAAVDMRAVAESLARLFPPQGGPFCDWQRLAALAAVMRPFVVISGGPGTGKTTTVARVIALLLEQQAGNDLSIALAAPTGKAVMRLQEVMSAARERLPCAASVKERIPSKVATLHRLLGPRQDSCFFRHDETNPLPYDLVIVDEASMVDLPMMAKLIRALKPSARLILLGDRNQLASVEPGAVLADICSQERLSGFSSKFIARASAITDVKGLPAAASGLADSLVELRFSHRFGEKSGISLLSRALQRGDSEAALEILRDRACPDVVWREIASGSDLRREISLRVANSPPAWFNIEDPQLALQRLDRFQFLCAVRRGLFGVEQINLFIEGLLGEKWGVVAGNLQYHGRPVMISGNNYELQLYNGDVGIIMRGTADNARIQAVFPGGDKGMRKIPLAMLPKHETVYAMTVHKSQGSEFDEVVVVLPDHRSPLLTRELLYTALTRARTKVEIWGNIDVFRAAVDTGISRHSGLRDKLRGL